MKIIWDSLGEIKSFLSMVNISELAKKEEKWGGLGFIIDDAESDCARNNRAKLSSEVITHSDTIIITTAPKELSWLFRNLYECTLSGRLSPLLFVDGFRVACIAFFIENQEYTAKELLMYVVDFIEGVCKSDNPGKTIMTEKA